MRLISGTGLSCAALLMAMTSAQADCKPELVAMTGESGPAQSDAERVARVTWEAQAARTYGNQYSHWSNADHRKIECEKRSSDSYQCWATANPCTP